MSCPLKNITLEAVSSGETWSGFTFQITESDDTAFAADLSRVRMTWKNSSGVASLTLDSNAPGEIIITTATGYAWEFTVESHTLALPAGIYSWAIETTDADGVVDKDFITGTHHLTTDPHS